ncbi:MAG: HAD hydrolase-like protein [Nodosilinea sp.]
MKTAKPGVVGEPTLTTFLFDFDGTLADSLSTIVEITNRLAPEFGYRPTPLPEVEALKGLTARQLIRYSGIPVFKIPALLRRLRSELRAHSAHHIAPCAGIPAAIRQLHAQNYPLAIITSNIPEVVHAFLAAHELSHCFISVDGGGSLFGKGRLIAKSLERLRLDPKTTVYVGDEVRDIQAARFAGIRPISVTWGFNSRAALAAARPDLLVDDPSALLSIAAGLSRREA